MKRFPTWLKILIPIFILGVILVVSLATLIREEVPPHAQPAALEARFTEQLAFLRELASDLPVVGCEERSHDELLALIDEFKLWGERVEAGLNLLDDPVILGAEILQMCRDEQNTFSIKSYGVKSYEGGDSAWSASMLSRREEWPSVSLWFAGTKRQVRYDSRIDNSGPDPLLVRLILDLEAL